MCSNVLGPNVGIPLKPWTNPRQQPQGIHASDYDVQGLMAPILAINRSTNVLVDGIRLPSNLTSEQYIR